MQMYRVVPQTKRGNRKVYKVADIIYQGIFSILSRQEKATRWNKFHTNHAAGVVSIYTFFFETEELNLGVKAIYMNLDKNKKDKSRECEGFQVLLNKEAHRFF